MNEHKKVIVYLKFQSNNYYNKSVTGYSNTDPQSHHRVNFLNPCTTIFVLTTMTGTWPNPDISRGFSFEVQAPLISTDWVGLRYLPM